MRICENIFRLIKASVAQVATLAVAFVISCGSVHVCLCDPDPDHCGTVCHDCAGAHEVHGFEMQAPDGECVCSQSDECKHATISAGDLFVTSHTVYIPAAAAEAVPWSNVHLCGIHCFRMRPTATAPPDPIVSYILTSSRLYPLS